MGAPSSTDPDVPTRVRRQEVVAELGQRALECDDVDRFLHDAAAAVAETLDADYCAVLERVPEGGAVLRGGVGWATGTGRETPPGEPLGTDGPVVADDPLADGRFAAAALLEDRDVAGVGVRIGPAEEPWGLLEAYATEPQSFAASDADFVDRVGDLLESAVGNLGTRSELEEVYGRISDAFFALDEEWRFTYLNERAHELINPDGRRLLGENVWEAFPEAVERQFKPAYERALYDQETVSFEEYYPEPLDAWFEVRAYPSETGLSVYFRDVTERRERERALEQSEQRYRTLAEYFPNGIVTLFDHDLEYTLAAGRGFDALPVDPDDLEGRAFHDVWPAETAEALRPAFRAALNGT
jgi:PAS domain S-box-containing protein